MTKKDGKVACQKNAGFSFLPFWVLLDYEDASSLLSGALHLMQFSVSGGFFAPQLLHLILGLVMAVWTAGISLFFLRFRVTTKATMTAATTIAKTIISESVSVSILPVEVGWLLEAGEGDTFVWLGEADEEGDVVADTPVAMPFASVFISQKSSVPAPVELVYPEIT